MRARTRARKQKKEMDMEEEEEEQNQGYVPDLPLASASPDMIRWSRVLLSHTLDAARSY